MRRSKFRLAVSVGVVCLSTAVVAGGAMAHGGHRVKFGKISKHGAAALKVEVRGAITAITPATETAKGTITLSAAGATTPAPAGFEYTCTLTKRTKIEKFKVGDRVKARCRNAGKTGLTLTMLRHRDKGDKVKVQARGAVEAFTAATATAPGTVTVNTGVAGQAATTCVVTTTTEVRGMPVIGGKVFVVCRSVSGVLTARHVIALPNVAHAKGPLTVNADGSITVGAVTCTVPVGTTLPAAGTEVRIFCKGTPLELKWIKEKPAAPAPAPKG